MDKLIIDVSEHQKEINWSALKKEIDGAILRCGYGDDDKSQDDLWWERNVSECERLNIPYGVYLYSYAKNDSQAKSEAAHAIRLLKGHKLSYPVYIDLEESSLGYQAKKTADIFCAALEKAGYFAGVYTYESFYNSFMSGYANYTLWIAKYSASKPQINVKYDAWQHTSSLYLKGYAGRLDASHFYRDFPAEISKNPVNAGTPDKVLSIAKSQIGVTNGPKYGKWYENNVDGNPNNFDFGARDVAWCAMFASWTFDQAGVRCAGFPGAYCPSMLEAAEKAGRAVAPKNAKPGDAIFFDWDGGESDHVGIVESNDGKQLVTIEGNTDNGIVARKVRKYDCCVKAVRPYYEQGATTSAPTTSQTSAKMTFRVSVNSSGKKWLAANKLKRGSAIRWIAIKGAGKYRVSTERNGWLPYVSKYDVTDLENGCAGDGSPINAIEVYSSKYRYAVRKLNGKWYEDMIGRTDTSGSNDHFAGDLANRLDGFRISKV